MRIGKRFVVLLLMTCLLAASAVGVLGSRSAQADPSLDQGCYCHSNGVGIWLNGTGFNEYSGWTSSAGQTVILNITSENIAASGPVAPIQAWNSSIADTGKFTFSPQSISASSSQNLSPKSGEIIGIYHITSPSSSGAYQVAFYTMGWELDLFVSVSGGVTTTTTTTTTTRPTTTTTTTTTTTSSTVQQTVTSTSTTTVFFTTTVTSPTTTTATVTSTTTSTSTVPTTVTSTVTQTSTGTGTTVPTTVTSTTTSTKTVPTTLTATSTVTQTSTVPTTVTSTATTTAPPATVTQTATTTTVSTTTATTSTVPALAYGAMVVLLVVGLAVGYVLKKAPAAKAG